MLKVKVDEKVTLQTIEELKRKYKTEELVITMNKTKYQTEDDLRKIANKYPKIFFSVLGGLNPQKTKFNNEAY